jgi:hypothetical protein
MRHLILILLIFGLSGCLSVRVPQLPIVDRLINPSDNPRKDERWLLTHGSYKRTMVPIDIRVGTIFLGGSGEYIVIDDKGVIKTQARMSGSQNIYNWRSDRENPLLITIFKNSSQYSKDRCTEVTDFELSCSRINIANKITYKAIREDNRFVGYEWQHPSTGKIVTLKDKRWIQ